MMPIDRRCIIGVSGIMGSGKTTVAREFEKLGAIRVDADLIGKQILRIPEVKKALVAAFGRSIMTTGGAIDRRKLAEVAFDSSATVAKLNRISHSYLIERLRLKVDKASKSSPIVVVDAALLPEWGIRSLLDLLIVVDASEETAIERCCRARGFARSQVLARMGSQLSRKGKLRRADVIIPNFGSLKDLKARAHIFFYNLVEIGMGGETNA